MDAAPFAVFPILLYAAASAETIRFNLPRTLPQGWTGRDGGKPQWQTTLRTESGVRRSIAARGMASRSYHNQKEPVRMTNGTKGKDLP